MCDVTHINEEISPLSITAFMITTGRKKKAVFATATDASLQLQHAYFNALTFNLPYGDEMLTDFRFFFSRVSGRPRE